MAEARLLLFDIDGTLTDATTGWGGAEVGWTQRYSVRDGEALLRMERAGLHVAALSRNRTRCAQERMQGLGVDCRWLGTRDKLASLSEAQAAFDVPSERVAYIGDGFEDAEVFQLVGLGVAVADAHPLALAAAHVVLRRRGGERAIEELEGVLTERGWLAQAGGLR